MTQGEEIIKKLEAGKALSGSEIEYIKKMFDAANTFIKIALEQSAGERS